MSYTISIGETAPNFSLLGTDALIYTLDHCKGSKGFVIFFTCNHCPYALNSNTYTKELAKNYLKKGIVFIAINSNSSDLHPEDSYEGMVRLTKSEKFIWPYLHDPNQNIARKYGALCTPHYFVFNQIKKLVYTGRAIDNPKNPASAKTHELDNALEAIVLNQPIKTVITNPIGCNIKWNGKEEKWMPKEACALV